MKRIISIFLCGVFLLTLCSCKNEGANEQELESATTASQPTSTADTSEKRNLKITVRFKSAMLYCVDTNEVMYEYNAHKKVAPASLAKLLTAIVTLENVSADTVFTVGDEQSLVHANSSLCLIRKGHRLKVYDLLTGMLVASGNDAAYAVAVNVARTLSDGKLSPVSATEKFVEEMMKKAEEIGLKDSRFTSPDGWDDENAYTSAYDMLLLSKYALSVPEIAQIVSYSEKYTVFASGENITWKSTNKLLDRESEYYSKYAIGTKTGTTKSAGNCLSAAFTKNGRTYIAVIMGSETDADRYKTALEMIQSV